MPCPECGCQVGEFRFANSVETHGLDCGPYETLYEEVVICRGCDGRFDPNEWNTTTTTTTEATMDLDPDFAASGPDEAMMQVIFDAVDYAAPDV
jgi:hypothetical protein